MVTTKHDKKKTIEEQMQGFDKFLKNAMERQRGTADYAVVTKRGNK